MAAWLVSAPKATVSIATGEKPKVKLLTHKDAGVTNPEQPPTTVVFICNNEAVDNYISGLLLLPSRTRFMARPTLSLSLVGARTHCKVLFTLIYRAFMAVYACVKA